MTQAKRSDRSADRHFAGYVRTPALDVSGVSLPATDGQQVNMTAGDGGLRLVFFGYTTCPDVCPATLGYVRMALASLSDTDRERVQVAMITVDPTRDVAAKLTDYVTQFVPDAEALRTENPDELLAAAKAFGASYSVKTVTDGEVEVAHSGDLFVVDDTGTVILAWPFGTSPGDIQDDLGRLLQGERPPSET